LKCNVCIIFDIYRPYHVSVKFVRCFQRRLKYKWWKTHTSSQLCSHFMYFVQEHKQIWDKALNKTFMEQEQLVQILNINLKLLFYYTHSSVAQTIKQQTSSCVSNKLASAYIKYCIYYAFIRPIHMDIEFVQVYMNLQLKLGYKTKHR